MELQNQIYEFCRRQGLLAPGDRVICAVSGGADSMALLWSLYLLRERLNLQLSAAHFNHGLRGGESQRDEAFVRDFCAGYDIPLTVGRGTVERQGRGLEDSARQARYAFLEGLDPTAKIATAHTAGDNAETVLLHLLRGSGLRGLGGIAPQRGRLIRPMLTVTRQEVENFLERWGLPHVEDSTNETEDFLRNRLRHQVMPVLEGENPRFARSCSRTAMELRQDEALLSQMAAQAKGTLCVDGALDCAGLLALHPALRRRVLAEFLQDCGVAEPEAVHIARAEALAAARKPSAMGEFPGDVILERRYDRLVKRRNAVPLSRITLSVPGEILTSGWSIRCDFLESGEKILNSPFTFTLACDKIGQSPLILRPRQPGDTIRLPGGCRSLKKLFVDRKIPASQRESIPVIATEGQVVAVAGVGADLDYLGIPGAAALQIVVHKI